MGLTFSRDDYNNAEALAAIARITSCNVWLVQRWFSQIARVLENNRLRTITVEVVEAAREPSHRAELAFCYYSDR